MPTRHLVKLPDFLSVSVQGDLFNPSIEALSGWDNDLQRYINRSVEISHPGFGVSSTVIHRIPIHRAISLAQRDLLRDINPDIIKISAVKSYFRGTTGRAVSAKIAKNPDDLHLENAAIIFHIAAAIRDKPIRSIERSFNITYDQAKRWVRIARRKNILER